MADKKFRLKIITPTEVIFHQEIEYLLIQTSEGQKGILPGHESCIELVSEGDIKVLADGREVLFKTAGGTLFLEQNEGVIMAELAALSSEYDEMLRMRAEELKRRYSEEVQSEIELQRIKMALRRSLMAKN